MIREQSCPSCTMASTTCDQSWGRSAPSPVHHAAKHLWCLTRPWESEVANPPGSTVCAPLQSMTNDAPWVPQLGAQQAIPEVPDTQTSLSLCLCLESNSAPVWQSDTTLFLQMRDLTFWCACDCSTAWCWDIQGIEAPSCYELIAHLLQQRPPPGSQGAAERYTFSIWTI